MRPRYRLVLLLTAHPIVDPSAEGLRARKWGRAVRATVDLREPKGLLARDFPRDASPEGILDREPKRWVVSKRGRRMGKASWSVSPMEARLTRAEVAKMPIVVGALLHR